MREWFDKVGLPYHSPHKFRHGYAVYTLSNSKTIAELKAISQNLMHTSIRTTDAIYGILSENDVRKNIQRINARIISKKEDTNDEIKNLLITILGKLEE